MNKTELFHLHSLLAAIVEDFGDRGSLAAADLEAYRALGTSQFDVRASRADHRDAVLALSGALSDAAERDAGQDAEPEVPLAD